MGYYTDYTISIENDEYIPNLEEELTKHTHYQWYSGTLDDAKWYEWERSMQLFSKKYPDALFKLYGKGEENEDVWFCLFKNGKSSGKVKPILTWPEIVFEGVKVKHD